MKRLAIDAIIQMILLLRSILVVLSVGLFQDGSGSWYDLNQGGEHFAFKTSKTQKPKAKAGVDLEEIACCFNRTKVYLSFYPEA